MPKLPASSIAKLRTCDIKIQNAVERAAELYGAPFVVVTGHRGEADQNKAKAEGKSRAGFGQSPHNRLPSQGVDLAPVKADGTIDWSDLPAFYLLAGFVRGVAAQLGVKLRAGADWDGDGATSDERLKDPGHLEIDGWR